MATQNHLDERIADHLTGLAQRLSRRGLLARLGKVALWAAGIELVPLLPADRAEAQTGGCSDWRYCGIFGNFCKSCCGQGSSTTQCPQCTFTGSYWQRCCEDSSVCPPLRRLIRYIDCCGTRPGFTDSQAAACQGAFCVGSDASQQPAWCGGTAAYRCTVISIGNRC